MVDFNEQLQYFRTAHKTRLLNDHGGRPHALSRFCTMIEEQASEIKPEDTVEQFTQKLMKISRIIEESREIPALNFEDKLMLDSFPVKIAELITQKRKALSKPFQATPVKVHLPPAEQKEPSNASQANKPALLEEISRGNNKNALEILKTPFNQWQINEKSSLIRYQYTPLILCAAKGAGDPDRKELITELLRLGADIHKVDSQNRTALHYACLHKDSKLISALVAKGAQWDTKDKNGQTALDFLFLDRQTASRILENAIEPGKDRTPFSLAEERASEKPEKLLESLIPEPFEGLPETILAKVSLNQRFLKAMEPFKNHIERLIRNSGLESQDSQSSSGTTSFFTLKPKERSEWQDFYLKLHTIATSMSTDNLYHGPQEIMREYKDKKLEIAALIHDKVTPLPPAEIITIAIQCGQAILDIKINEKTLTPGPENENKGFEP